MLFVWKTTELPKCILCKSNAAVNRLEVRNENDIKLGEICSGCVSGIAQMWYKPARGEHTVSGYQHIGLVQKLSTLPIKEADDESGTMIHIFKEVVNAYGEEDIPSKRLSSILQEKGFSKIQAEDTIMEGLSQGFIYERRQGIYKKA